jgi:hypothetical protein
VNAPQREIAYLALLSIYFSKAAVDLHAGLLAPQLRICQITQGGFQ